MCFDPVSLAIMGGLKLGETALRKDVQGDIIRKRNAATRKAFAQQDKYGQEAMSAVDQSAEGLKRENQDSAAADAAAARDLAAKQAISKAPGYVPQPGAGSGAGAQIVGGEIARKMTDALAKVRQQAAARAKLGAMGDVQFGNQLALGESARTVNRRGMDARQTAAILPLQYQAITNNTGQGRLMLADLFRMGGDAAMMAGGMGMFAPKPQIDPLLIDGSLPGAPVHAPGVLYG